MTRFEKIAIIIILAIIVSPVIVFVHNTLVFSSPLSPDISVNTSGFSQTDVANAIHSTDENGVPVLTIENVGSVYNPAFVGLYALGYAGCETYDPSLFSVKEEPEKFNACVEWLRTHLEQNDQGDFVWIYPFNNTYNDVTILAPWSSAFGQAVGIQALLESYRRSGNPDDLFAAKQAATPLMREVKHGGLMFRDGDDVWFEEVPYRDNSSNNKKNSHILNGHMRTLLALHELYEESGDPQYLEMFDAGLATLIKWLPLYDSGYALKYDLNPQKTDLLFRFANPYGDIVPAIPIDKIDLTDPLTNDTLSIDIGSPDDFNSTERISGTDWSPEMIIDNRTVRYLQPHSIPDTQLDWDGEIHAPTTFFYLSLPGEWNDNTRSESYILTITYKDINQKPLAVQTKSSTSGRTFINIKNSDLFLSGSGEWRIWNISVSPSYFNSPISLSEQIETMNYLKYLGGKFPSLSPWSVIAQYYVNVNQIPRNVSYNLIIPPGFSIPSQTSALPIWSFDENGVIQDHKPTEKTLFKNGFFDRDSDFGEPRYSPYVVARQALLGNLCFGSETLPISDYINQKDTRHRYNYITSERIPLIEKEPAINWLKNNAIRINDSYIWTFDYDNVYNDVISPKGWASSFSQRYILEVFESLNQSDWILPTINAYKYETKDGGITSYDKNGDIWFEEVPQNTHILNAHIASLVMMGKMKKRFPDSSAKELFEQGMASLKKNLHLYEAGYWSKYDLNPKKEILFQIDLLSGNTSPSIDKIVFLNPATENATAVDVGTSKDMDMGTHISGIEWSMPDILDGKTVRSFQSGDSLHTIDVPGGTRQNSYLIGILPDRFFSDYFDVPTHFLIISYKDTAPSTLQMNVQSINEGTNLSFVPLHDGIIHCTGDNKWKTASIPVRPQDLGWYMGPDYQKYHNEQLSELVNQTGDWFLDQYLQKWAYYLSSFEQYPLSVNESIESPIMEKIANLSDGGSSPFYPEYDLSNSLDGDPEDDYTAAVEGILPQAFHIRWNESRYVPLLDLTWESEENYGKQMIVRGLQNNSTIFESNLILNTEGKNQIIFPDPRIKMNELICEVTETVGQKRILLRQVTPYALSQLLDVNLIPNITCDGSSPFYSGYGLNNSFDGDPDNDYSGAVEGVLPQTIYLRWNEPAYIPSIDFIWESDENYASKMVISGLLNNVTQYQTESILNEKGKYQVVLLDSIQKINALRCDIFETKGQERILLRQITPHALSKSIYHDISSNIAEEVLPHSILGLVWIIPWIGIQMMTILL